MENRYVELTNDVQNRGNIRSVESLRSVDPRNGEEWYRSLYIYDREMVEYGRIQGFQGRVYPDFIPIDVDGENALNITRGIILTLEDFRVPDYAYKVFFSGRGFHICLAPELFGFQPSRNLPKTVKDTMIKFFPDADDIFDRTRIFRLPNSINKKSGLYKILLTYREMHDATMDQIEEMAKEPRTDNTHYEIFTEEEKSEISQVFHPIEDNVSKSKIVAFDPEIDQFHCFLEMLNEGAVKGHRHNVLLRILSHMHRHHYPKWATHSVAREWMGDEMEDYGAQQFETDVDSVYSKHYMFGCKDTEKLLRCNPRCKLYTEQKVLNSFKLAENLYNFENTDYPKFSLNWLREKYYAIPGMVVQVLSDTGIGKSAFAQNWLINQPKVPSLYISLEMSYSQIYRRFIQAKYKLNKEEAVRRIKNDKTFGADELSHISVITEKIKVEEIEKIINAITSPPLVIVIDHLLLMDSEKSEEYAKIAELTGKFKQFALKNNKIVLSLSQVSREVSKTGKYGIHSGKGNSSIEQDADTVILVHRDSKDSPNMHIWAVKEREGMYFDRLARYNGETMRISV